MKAAILFLFLGTIANAQLLGDLNRSSDGTTQIVLRNEGSVPVTAVAIRIDYVNRITRNPTSIYVFNDAVTNSLIATRPGVLAVASVPIASGQQVAFSPEVMVAVSNLSGRPTFSDLRIAGMFTDGSTSGEAELLRKLIERRTSLLRALDTSLDLLSEARQQQVSQEELVRRLQKRSAELDRWYLSSEQQIGKEVFQSVLEAFRISSTSRISSDSLYNTETARLRQQRIALLSARPGLATEMAP